MKSKQNDHASEVLNDLLKINNDRVAGYKKAEEETNENDLKSLFYKFESESEKFADALTQEVSKLGGSPDTESTTNPGKIYRVWMGVKATFSGKDRKSVLAACEYGEDAAQKAYNTALEDDELSGELRTLIKLQQSQLKLAHDTIRSMRDRAN